jgi:hypothetical protein
MVNGISTLRMVPHAGHIAPKPKSQTAATPATSDPGEPSFSSWFPGTVNGGPPIYTQPAAPQNTAPTAESVFGPNPWFTNPTGSGPNGTTVSYNPFYFATPATAAKVAQMVGGTVVQSNPFTPNGGPFQQQQPCLMVQLQDGRMINPGLVASFYTHGYPQSYIDMMVAAEVRNA